MLENLSTQEIMKPKKNYAINLEQLKIGEILMADMTQGYGKERKRTGIQSEVEIVDTKFNPKTWRKEYRCRLIGNTKSSGVWVAIEYLHLYKEES